MPLKTLPPTELARVVADYDGIRQYVQTIGLRMVPMPQKPKDPERTLIELEARGHLKINFTRRGYIVVWALCLEPGVGYVLAYRQRGRSTPAPRAEGHWGYHNMPQKHAAN